MQKEFLFLLFKNYEQVKVGRFDRFMPISVGSLSFLVESRHGTIVQFDGPKNVSKFHVI